MVRLSFVLYFLIACLIMPVSISFAEEHWYNITVMDIKIGYGHISTEKTIYQGEVVDRHTMDIVVNFKEFGNDLTYKTTNVEYTGSDLMPRYFLSTSNEESGLKQIEGRIINRIAHIKTTLNGKSTESKVLVPPDTISEYTNVKSLFSKGFKIGDRRSYHTLDLDLLEPVKIEIKVEGQDTLTYQSKRKRVYVLRGTMDMGDGVTIKSWVDSDGIEYKAEATLMGLSMVMTKTDKETVLGGTEDIDVNPKNRMLPAQRRPVQKTTANQVYGNAIRAVMWIVNPGIAEGSGVLIDKKLKLVVTNAHVTGKQGTLLDIYFPAPNKNGELIKDRNFYLNSSGVLKQLGYYTKGHVVARNEKTDLAIIWVEGLPETAREIDWSVPTPTRKAGDIVYILGNPDGRDLWRWTLGEYLKEGGNFLHIQSDIFAGNSGGPVLSKQGILLGVVARSDNHMNAFAIPARYIDKLLSESKIKHSRSRR